MEGCTLPLYVGRLYVGRLYVGTTVQYSCTLVRYPVLVNNSLVQYRTLYSPLRYSHILDMNPFKGTGTRVLIWLKVVSLDRSWLVGLTDDH